MSTRYEIPLSPNPQTFNISLAGVTYQLRVLWNSQSSSWILDIQDNLGNLVIGGISVVTGRDLLEPYGYLNFGGQLIASVDNSSLPPNSTNLGTTGHIYFVTTP